MDLYQIWTINNSIIQIIALDLCDETRWHSFNHMLKIGKYDPEAGSGRRVLWVPEADSVPARGHRTAQGAPLPHPDPAQAGPAELRDGKFHFVFGSGFSQLRRQTGFTTLG